MSVRDFILYAALIIFVLYITRINNMWGVSKGTNKAKADVRIEKNNLKKRNRTLKYLSIFTWVDRNIGGGLNEFKEKDYKYKLDRLRWTVKILNRPLKPTELSGLMKLMQLVGAFLLIVGFLLTNSIYTLIFLIPFLAPAIFHVYASSKISDEDARLERDFPDLFIILYSRLVQGSRSRLAPTLKDYLVSLDAVKGKGKEHDAIKNFVLDLRNNIEVYGDDGMAVRKMRDKYRSVMIINFCNLVVQSLNGVDNKDKLLAFKIELNGKRVEQMKIRADQLVKRGSRAIIVVYVILFQFILLSWIAKLTQAGGVGSIFGI